ncbi:MAG: 1-deoxy-D-xylulose-5-phosphate reductoisomerase [Rhodospirillaceae bacterium]|jgi:1-deoxy-D-xylulose-5-phosphate reductoisomerase|nr:1-deoxy-D-xylulose-5-phosphate reductoisomerase [Rhodospirillaceae bacterium]
MSVAKSNNIRSVTILGSTGSIGCKTIDLIELNPERFSVDVLVANCNAEKLAEQAKRLNPHLVVVAQNEAYLPLKEALFGYNIEVASGSGAVIDATRRPTDFVMAAIIGAIGLESTLVAIQRGAIVGLANKEALVCAGSLMMTEVERCHATLIPVDSEHSAIFQVLDVENYDSVDRIILTASGGPFRTFDIEQMMSIIPEDAIVNPNWSMGAKTSVDSATMMNKGLELIEAHNLFGLAEDRIDILIHPQSIIHSMVSYIDGSILAHLGMPDMQIPISLALGWPKRMSTLSKKLDLSKIATLTFEAPDPVRFPALCLARNVLRKGGVAPTIFNASNEISVGAFLEGRIGFLDIVRLVEQVVDKLGDAPLDAFSDIYLYDNQARQMTKDLVAKFAHK